MKIMVEYSSAICVWTDISVTNRPKSYWIFKLIPVLGAKEIQYFYCLSAENDFFLTFVTFFNL